MKSKFKIIFLFCITILFIFSKGYASPPDIANILIFKDPQFKPLPDFTADDVTKLLTDKNVKFRIIDHDQLETIADPEIRIIIIPYVRGNFSNNALANLLKLHGKGIGLLFLEDLPNKDKWYPLRNMQSSLFHLTHVGASITVEGLIEKVREINYPDRFGGGSVKGAAVSVHSPGEVILTDSSGEPVLIRKAFGKGAVLLAGWDTSTESFEGERNYFQQPGIKDHTLVRLVSYLELEPVDVRTGQLNVWKALISRNNKDYLIIYSHLKKPVKQTFTIPVNTRYGRYFSFFDK